MCSDPDFSSECSQRWLHFALNHLKWKWSQENMMEYLWKTLSVRHQLHSGSCTLIPFVGLILHDIFQHCTHGRQRVCKTIFGVSALQHKIVWLILWVLIEKCIFSLTQKIHVVTEESFRNYWFNYTKLRLINGYFTIPLPLTIIPLTFHELYLLWSTYLLTVI